MSNKTTRRSKLWIVLIIVAIVIIAGLLVSIFKPNWIPSLFNKIIESPVASKEPDPLAKYLVKGASDSSTILVKFKDNVSETRINQIHAATKTKTKKVISKINTRVVTVPTNVTTGETLAKFKVMPEVEYAEPNFTASAFLTPNDPLYSSQWGLTKMSAPTAWDSAKGNFGSVGVVDTGILSSHPDLAGEVTAGYNFV